MVKECGEDQKSTEQRWERECGAPGLNEYQLMSQQMSSSFQ